MYNRDLSFEGCLIVCANFTFHELRKYSYSVAGELVQCDSGNLDNPQSKNSTKGAFSLRELLVEGRRASVGSQAGSEQRGGRSEIQD